MKFWNFVKNEETGDVELRIDGEIISDDDAWIYEWFGIPVTSPNAFREALAEHNGKPITVWIDSWGGDVFAGVGIYNALMEHKGDVTVKIDGKAVSAASIIAMAGTEVLMSPASIIMVHNPLTYQEGEAKDMRKSAEVLDEVKESIVNVYEIKTGRTREDISGMMDNETWMSAKTAVAEKFADGILYTENQVVENSYSLSGMAIQNSMNEAMKKFFEVWQKQRAEGDKEQDPPPEPADKKPENTQPPEENPTAIAGRVFDKRVTVREINHRRIQTHG